MAEYMPRIILEAPDGSSGFPNWGPAGCVGWRPAASSTLSRSGRLGDDGAVDVREHVVLHLIPSDGRDDRAVGDRDHESGVVHEDHRVAGALARGTIDPVLEALHHGRVDREVAALEALDGVLAELDGLRARRVLEDVREARTLSILDGWPDRLRPHADRRGVGGGRHPRRYQRGIERVGHGR